SAGAVGYTWTRTVRTDGGAGAIVTLTGSVIVTGDGANIELNFPSPVSEGYNSYGTVTGDGTLQVLGGGVDVSSSGGVTLEATPAATATGRLRFSLSFIEGVAT